jgi:hypothetical protein
MTQNRFEGRGKRLSFPAHHSASGRASSSPLAVADNQIEFDAVFTIQHGSRCRRADALRSVDIAIRVAM